jgi:hypothetical protein
MRKASVKGGSRTGPLPRALIPPTGPEVRRGVYSLIRIPAPLPPLRPSASCTRLPPLGMSESQRSRPAEARIGTLFSGHFSFFPSGKLPVEHGSEGHDPQPSPGAYPTVLLMVQQLASPAHELVVALAVALEVAGDHRKDRSPADTIRTASSAAGRFAAFATLEMSFCASAAAWSSSLRGNDALPRASRAFWPSFCAA